MNPGKLRHRITFQSLIELEDELGQQIGEEWVDVKSVWSMVKTLQGREYFAAAATQAEKTVRFVIRYTTGVDETMRILYKGKPYEIIAPPINDDEVNKTITIIARS
jgi:SPP1 family predicted phage head-tail adaptor